MADRNGDNTPRPKIEIEERKNRVTISGNSTRKRRNTTSTRAVVGVELSIKPGKLSREDVTCPICWSVLLEPTTLPCKHSLCISCYRKHVEETSLCCPCCRRRLSIWSRKVFKHEDLLDGKLWERVKAEFPKLVDARLNDIDSQKIFESEAQWSEDVPPTLINANAGHNSTSSTVVRDGTNSDRPGEIFIELKQIMEPHQKDIEIAKQLEETATANYIKQLQEEERIRKASTEEQDFLLAKRLQEEELSRNKISPIKRRTRSSAKRLKLETSMNQPSKIETDPGKSSLGEPCEGKYLRDNDKEMGSVGETVTEILPTTHISNEEVERVVESVVSDIVDILAVWDECNLYSAYSPELTIATEVSCSEPAQNLENLDAEVTSFSFIPAAASQDDLNNGALAVGTSTDDASDAYSIISESSCGDTCNFGPDDDPDFYDFAKMCPEILSESYKDKDDLNEEYDRIITEDDYEILKIEEENVKELLRIAQQRAINDTSARKFSNNKDGVSASTSQNGRSLRLRRSQKTEEDGITTEQEDEDQESLASSEEKNTCSEQVLSEPGNVHNIAEMQS